MKYFEEFKLQHQRFMDVWMIKIDINYTPKSPFYYFAGKNCRENNVIK